MYINACADAAAPAPARPSPENRKTINCIRPSSQFIGALQRALQLSAAFVSLQDVSDHILRLADFYSPLTLEELNRSLLNDLIYIICN
jgi:hypothetical protein